MIYVILLGDVKKLFFASVGTVVGTVAGGFPGGVAGNAIGTMAGNMAADVFTRDMGCKRDEGDIFRKVN